MINNRRQAIEISARAQIFWQLGTLSGRYSVWIYAHRLTRDSLFQIQNEVVRTKLSHEESSLTSLLSAAGPSPSASERTVIAAQAAFVEELRAMLDEVKRVAPIWSPDLNDGIVLTMAPLWRLVPQNKSWQKELRSKWDELVAGKYQWAHIAMHLWPERTVAACAEDRSLAIAHGLESEFWIEAAGGKWTSKANHARVTDIIKQRSLAAIKSSLNSLLEAVTTKASRSTARRKGHR